MKVDIKKIAPYFFGMRSASRVFIYLLATGEYTIDQGRQVTVKELKAFAKKIPDELALIDVCDELVYGKKEGEGVFFRSKGRIKTINDTINMLKLSHKAAGVEYKGLAEFVRRVEKK